MKEFPLILQLDVAGNPQSWIDYEKAAYYSTKNLIAWTLTDDNFEIQGGICRRTGQRSKLNLNTIIAVQGKISQAQIAKINHVSLTNRTLFQRDKNICGYCGDQFPHYDLSRDHIMPSSRGGPNTWMNVITACKECNIRKCNKTPEEAGMHLLFVPYVPNKAEHLIMSNRNILADQMEFLISRVPKQSRLL